MIMKDFFYIAVTGFALFTIFPGCSGGNSSQQPVAPQPIEKQAVNPQTVISETISSQDSRRLIQENDENPGFLIVDVRTPREFSEKQIAGAINIDYYASDFKSRLNRLDKSKKILLYCRTGRRSGSTLPIMKELGFIEVYNMQGGITAWEANNYPLVSP